VIVGTEQPVSNREIQLTSIRDVEQDTAVASKAESKKYFCPSEAIDYSGPVVWRKPGRWRDRLRQKVPFTTLRFDWVDHGSTAVYIVDWAQFLGDRLTFEAL